MVGEDGEIDASGTGLPEPGFEFELPDGLTESDILSLEFTAANTDRTWEVELYDGVDENAQTKIYKLVPTYGTTEDPADPIRVQFTDPEDSEKAPIISDTFIVGKEVNKTFHMSLYTGENVNITTTTEEDETYTVALGTGELTVRGTTSEVEYAPVNDENAGIATAAIDETAKSDFEVTAEAGTTYTINDSTVKVTNDEAVALLVDEIIDTDDENRTNLLIEEAKEQHEELADDYAYEFKYLDLVDTSNGNVWVAASEDVTISWPLPKDADPETVKVLHFEDLDRNMTGDIADAISEAMVTELSKENDGLTITNDTVSFDVGTAGFSPFALAYQTKDTEGPNYNDLKDLIKVTVACTNDKTPEHGEKKYGLLEGSYDVDLDEGDDTCAITIHADKYVVEYSKDTNRDLPHGLVDYDNGRTDTIELTHNGTTWELADGEDGTVTFKVKCGSKIIHVTDPGEDHWYPVYVDPEDPTDPGQTGVADLLETDDHIQYLFGYPDDSFGPNNNMTRAEAAQMFYNLLKDQDVEAASVFDDVPEGAWYATPVNVMAELGIVNGVGDDKFEPNRQITRAEFTAMAMRFAKVPSGGENIFTDVKPTDWFYSYVVNSIQYGWIEGYGDGTFRPGRLITRAEVTTIVNRMLDRQADMAFVIQNRDKLTKFTDLTTEHWAYYTIVEATNEHNYKKPAIGEDWTSLKK